MGNGDNFLVDTVITGTKSLGIMFSKNVVNDCSTITGVQVWQAGLDGLSVPSVTGQDLRIFVQDSRFNANKRHGIGLFDRSIFMQASGNVCVSLTNVQANGNTQDGVNLLGYSGVKLDARNLEVLTNGSGGFQTVVAASQVTFPPVEILMENLLAVGNSFEALNFGVVDSPTQVQLYGDITLVGDRRLSSLGTLRLANKEFAAGALTASLFGSLLVAGTEASIVVDDRFGVGPMSTAVLNIEDGAQAEVCGATTIVETINGGEIMVADGGTLACANANGVTCTESCPTPSYCQA